MKKLFLLSLAAIMVLILAACGDSATSTEATTASKAANLVGITMDSGLSIKLPSELHFRTLTDLVCMSAPINLIW